MAILEERHGSWVMDIDMEMVIINGRVFNRRMGG